MSLNVVDTVRAWKDEMYRNSLSSDVQATLPESPVGTLELSDADLEDVNGGGWGGYSGCRCYSGGYHRGWGWFGGWW